MAHCSELPLTSLCVLAGVMGLTGSVALLLDDHFLVWHDTESTGKHHCEGKTARWRSPMLPES